MLGAPLMHRADGRSKVLGRPLVASQAVRQLTETAQATWSSLASRCCCGAPSPWASAQPSAQQESPK